MTFEVIVSPSAQADVKTYAEMIEDDSVQRATIWAKGAVELIQSLGEMPHRFPIFEHHGSTLKEIRYVSYHSHLVIFEIDKDNQRVYVLRVWSGKRRYPKHADLT